MNILLEDRSPEARIPACPVLKLLKKQRALVTLADRGIGGGVAVALARAGADVALHCVDGDSDMEQVVEEIVRCGSRPLPVRADLSDEPEVQSMFAQTVEAFGGIDLLVCNDATSHHPPNDERTPVESDEQTQCSLAESLLCMREAVHHFRRQGARPSISCASGKIVCLQSSDVLNTLQNADRSKAQESAYLDLMRDVAMEAAPYRIRVNAIRAGLTRTVENARLLETPEARHELLERVPYKRLGDVSDIGRAVAWLASDQADYIHGTTLVVDGGMALGPSPRARIL